MVWFYGISTNVGHLMPNPFYTYIKYGEMVDSGESDKMIKISRKMDKSNTMGLVVIFSSLLIELHQTKRFFGFFLYFR